MKLTEAHPHFHRIDRQFQGLRAVIRSLFVADGVSRLLLAVGLFILATFTLDVALNLPMYVRLTFLAGGLGLFGFVIWRHLVRPLLVSIPDDDLALFVERQYPELNDRLISAIQLSRSADGTEDRFNSPELVAALANEAFGLAHQLDFRRGLIWRHVGVIGGLALGLALLLGAVAAVFPTYAGIYARRAIGLNVRWPQKVRLNVLDFKERKRDVARGEDVVIAVEVEKLRPGVRTPSSLTLYYRYVKSGEKGEKELEAAEEGHRFLARFERVSEDFVFTVEGGDDRTEVHEVNTQTPPTLELRVWLEYPPYLRLPTKHLRTGHFTAPLFTKVRFEGDANVALTKAEIGVGPKGKEDWRALTIRDEKTVSGEFQITEPYFEYTFSLEAKNRLFNRDPLRYSVRGEEDKKPSVQILDPGGEQEDVSEVCVRPFEILVKDDYGVAEIDLEYLVRGGNASEWTRIPLWRPKTDEVPQTQIPVECWISLPEPKETDPAKRDPRVIYVLPPAKPGEHVDVRIRAADFKDVGERNLQTSTTIRLSVKPLTEIERALQDEIDRIKRALSDQRRKQDDEYRRAGTLERKLRDVETLSDDQTHEVRTAEGEQSGIANKLTMIRTDIRRVRRRGVYNGVFDPASAMKLENEEYKETGRNPGAADILAELIGDPTHREKFGVALSAVQSLDEAGAAKDRTARSAAIRAAQDLQSATLTGIQKALDMLEKWANYQEVIRITREILEIQKRVNKQIQGIGPK